MTRSATVVRLELSAFAGAALLAALALRHQASTGKSIGFLLSAFVGGASMFAAAALIRRRRPTNRCWWLLLAASAAFWIGDFEHYPNREVAQLGFVFGRWTDVFLAWAVLAYPSGRLQRTAERVVVAWIVAASAARSLSRLLLFVPPDTAGFGTRNRYLPIEDDGWWLAIEDWHGRALTVGIVAMLVVVAHRWVTSSTTTRQMLTPSLVAGSMLAACVFYQYQFGWNSRLGDDIRIFYAVWWAYGALALSLAFGMVRLRRTRSAIIDVFSELGDDAPPDRLRAALAVALGDPSLTLLPWSGARQGYLDNSGNVAELPVDRPGRAVTMIQQNGEPMAALVHDDALLEDPGLVNAVVAAVRLTIDNEQLQSELEQRLIEVAASRARIVEAGDAERRRIERDLHDGAQQRLVAAAVALQLAGLRIGEEADPQVHTMLEQVGDELRAAITDLRNLARGIHPTVLTEFGLSAALESLVNRMPLAVALEVDVARDPADVVAATAYFTVAEALTNAMKHAEATSVRVQVIGDDEAIRITIVDDGRGGANLSRGTGMAGIADRIATVGGTIDIHSPIGAGTRIQIELPCASS